MRYRSFFLKISLFLLFLLTGLCLFSCGTDSGTPADSDASDSPDAVESADEPAAPTEADLTKPWVIVRSDMDDSCLDSIRMIRSAFKELFGYEPKIKTDFLMNGETPGEYEILVGKTERESGASVYETVTDGVYTYQVLSENVIVIAGDNAKNTRTATEQFLLDCFGYTVPGTGKAANPAIGASFAGEYVAPFQNPVLKGYADPDVLYYEGVYYFYATSSRIDNGYEVLTSTDLVNWKNHGNCLDTSSGKTNSWGLTKWYWAPDVEEHNGKFYMLASVDEHLGLMVADSPLGPFVPQDGFLFERTIDGHIYFEGDDMYIYYVSWRTGHPYGIWGCKMKDDYITPDLKTEKQIIAPTESYEKTMGAITEGPYMLKKDGVYYMTYSGSDYQSQYYCVCYATSDSPLGTYKKYKGNPILVSDGERVFGTGHHCITTMPDSDQMVIVYHIHNDKNSIHPRHTSMDLIRFKETADGWILECDGPNIG